MSRKADASVTVVARQVAMAVSHLQREVGIPHAELIRRGGFSPNYYYKRLRAEEAFDLDDLANLAEPLGVTPIQLMELADTMPIVQEDDRGVVITLDGAELGRRLRFLKEMSLHQLDFETVNSSLVEQGFSFDQEGWDSLTSAVGQARIHKAILEALADAFHVEAEYLTDTGRAEAADRLEAQIEFDRAFADHDVQRIAARSLGNLDAAELRAIAAAIRS